MEDQELYSLDEAAKLLAVSRRRVLQLLQGGQLQGDRGAGQEGDPWRGVYRWSVHNRRDSRPARKKPAEDALSPAEAREWIDRATALERQLGRLEGRLELEAVARSTLEEQLQRERDRADRLEEELSEARRPWWRRIFS